LSGYFSSKLEARVDIKRINFSIMGNLSIEELMVWDPRQNKILSVREMTVTTRLSHLITGELTFEEIHVAGVDATLIRNEDGLNIQYIIDAFFKPTGDTDTTSSTPINLRFKNILLEEIVFTSTVNGVTTAANLGTLRSRGVEFSTRPNKIIVDEISLDKTAVNVLSTWRQDMDDTAVSSDGDTFTVPDSGGLILDIKALALTDNEFSFHQDKVQHTPKFDHAHIELKDIQLSLSNILIHDDTYAADLQALAVQLPGFTLTDARADIQVNRNQLVLSGLHLASGMNEIRADLTTTYELTSVQDNAHVKIAAQFNPGDFGYFFSDSAMNQFNWGGTTLALEGNYAYGKGTVKILDLKTDNSRLQAEGMVNDVLDIAKINWKDFKVLASIGSDFQKSLAPLISNIAVPPDVSLLLNSSGNFKSIFVDGEVSTTWGNLKAIGRVYLPSRNVGLDIKLIGEKVDFSEWINEPSLGPMDLSVVAKGLIGDDMDIEIDGLISHVALRGQSIHDIAFQSRTKGDSAAVTASIADPNYRSEISSEISFAGPVVFTNDVQLFDFKPGNLLNMDSSLSISAITKSKITIDQSSIEGHLEGASVLLTSHSGEYSLDTMAFHAFISPTSSDIKYYTDSAKASVVSNFDIRDLPRVIQAFANNILKDSADRPRPVQARVANVDIDIKRASFFKLLGIGIDDFSSLRITGEFNEQKQAATLEAASGKFRGSGISLDTLYSNLSVLRNNTTSNLNVNNLSYRSIELGDLNFDAVTKGDTALSNLRLLSSTSTLLRLQAQILPTDSGALLHADSLTAFDRDYTIDPENSVHIGAKSMVWNNFQIGRDSMQIRLDGDLKAFDVSINNADLTPLNYLISPDTTIINNGYLTGKISYSRNQHLNLRAEVDELRLYNSNPLTITATAVSDGNRLPFQFLLTNASNKIDLNGEYYPEQAEVDAALAVDVTELELFAFLVSGFIDEMHGALKGNVSINGSIKKPTVKGYLQFLDVGLTTVNPRLTFTIKDDVITIDGPKLQLDDFTIYDRQQNPLILNGNLTTENYQSFAYDLRINSDQYTLIDNPESTNGKLRGQLVIGSDIILKGNEKDTHVEAKLTIKDATDLSLVLSDNGIELLTAEGIVDFIDPGLLPDSIALEPSASYYDSLIASLPEFNLNSMITIEDSAVLRVIIDEQSGDYIEASGGANLELNYDRTGTLHLSGTYTILKGLYRLSFYDLVKKNFMLVKGSSINWVGNPKNGELDIKALHTVESNSIGLIGHEVGENEKSIYKKSLDYEVGINITGTIEQPTVSFSLDLPQNDKASYPVLANKLERLRQPEYESELNKQVFGLLVLEGFIPEGSGSDINSSLIATTALSNSVNSLLASQLNRFASQYIKGVDIDVGIQSYSDYSAPGGKTQTAIDFRVSKSMMNDRLSFEIGGDFDINADQSGSNTGTKNYRGDIAIIYDLTGNGDKRLKLFNNETYDIIYQEIRNTGISLIFIREFERKTNGKNSDK
jgi:hypothetical protein